MGNLTLKTLLAFTLSLPLTHSQETELASDILYEVAVTSPFVYMDKPVTIGAEEVEIARRLAIRLSVKAYVFDVSFEKAFQTNVTKRGIRCLRQEKIPRPAFEVIA
ncbi:hypothetical protein GW915_10655 [bacterium]|nr:hypothetical protein [bacterium]